MNHSQLLENYESLSIRKLGKELRKNGFTYRLVERNNKRCIYSQLNELGKIMGYEVFLTKLGDLKKAKKRWAILKNQKINLDDFEEYYEIFPSDEEFGLRAWTYPTLQKAEEAFNSK